MSATKTKPTIRRQFDPGYKGTPGIANDEPSMTMPDQHMSIHTLLRNHTRGLGNDQHREGYYSEEIEVPRFTDILEAREYAEELKAKKDAVEAEIAELERERKKKAEEEAEAKKRAQIIAEHEKSKQDGEA